MYIFAALRRVDSCLYVAPALLAIAAAAASGQIYEREYIRLGGRTVAIDTHAITVAVNPGSAALSANQAQQFTGCGERRKQQRCHMECQCRRPRDY